MLAACGNDDPEQCKVLEQTGCDEGLVCEEVDGAEPACFQPVAVDGRVFDIGTNAGIEGARVVAVDVNGAAVSNVVTSGTDGAYRLPIPARRAADGTPLTTSTVLLRADAAGYESFPGTVRQPLPIDTAVAVAGDDGALIVKSTLTDVAMLQLATGGGTGVITGKVELPGDSTGIVVVAEADGIGHAAVAARDGRYAILNLAPASYTVTAYAVDHNYTPGTVDVADVEVKLDLALSADATSTVTGSVEIVDGGGATTTSVVLFIASTYDATTGRGITVPGLRAPRTGIPDVTGAFSMTGVPAGNYVVVAAFENDGLVRDPDLCIAGTDDVFITVAAATPLDIADGFKLTGALAVMDPGASAAQLVADPQPTFTWADDSSEDQYLLEVFDSYGQLVWSNTMAGVTGGTPAMTYGGPALTPGMYYQFRVTSSAAGGGANATRCNRSRTEDLRGVFYTPL